MTTSDLEIDRMYRILDYASHRLAEMNAVLGRLQGVASTFIGFSIAALAAIIALEIADTLLLLTIVVSVSVLLVSSVIMMRASMTRVSRTKGLGKTAWFYRENIKFDDNQPEAYTATKFDEDLIKFKEILKQNDSDWKNDCSSQILQLFITQKGRMFQIGNMSKAFRYGLYISVSVLIIGLCARAVLYIIGYF